MRDKTSENLQIKDGDIWVSHGEGHHSLKDRKSCSFCLQVESDYHKWEKTREGKEVLKSAQKKKIKKSP